MAISTEDSTEKDSVLTDASIDGHVDVFGRPDSTGGQNQEDANTVEEDKAAVTESELHPAIKADLNKILESLRDSLDKTQHISSRIDALSSETERLTNQVNNISTNCELLAAKMEATATDAKSKNMLSKTFLTISSLAIASLVIFQIYMFVSQLKMQQLQNASGSTVLQNITSLNSKMADYNKNLSKTLEAPPKPENTQPAPAASEKSGHETLAAKEAGPAAVTPVQEKLNRLRSGLPEKKLVRKETGDWFVFNKKTGECIADVDVIEALNQAYRKIGRSLPPTVPLPAHNALCILKPDGKGGTEVVMTKEFLP